MVASRIRKYSPLSLEDEGSAQCNSDSMVESKKYTRKFWQGFCNLEVTHISEKHLLISFKFFKRCNLNLRLLMLVISVFCLSPSMSIGHQLSLVPSTGRGMKVAGLFKMRNRVTMGKIGFLSLVN